ncbi:MULTISPECIES: AraC family transcriptional regulator [Caproicibacterium]|uniref:AraC family transcriptional regulator n=1 Tax=Caproicibacterium argilliputei TaxID=3030016 RepID=A0AA97H1S1_9FIRM|nr:AraC family transcriptional regulator [Caproicibacterium argilliputei]WOC31592.1 AraC family transcriptional regulator [Caproicibacterium argilliputei]
MNSTNQSASLPPVSSELNFLSCGEQHCSPAHTFGPAVQEQYLLSYCVSGHGIFQVDGEIYALNPQQGILTLPGELVFHQADLHDPWHGLWVAFSGTLAEPHLARCGLTAAQRLFHCEQPKTMQAVLQQMQAHLRLSYSDEFYLQGLLYQWLGLLAAAAALPYRQAEKAGNVYVCKAVEFMQKNYQHNISVAELSAYVGLNRSYLTFLFQREMQMAPRDYLLHLRMKKACTLLYQSELPVGQIAHSCGYPDPLAFSKAFRRQCGSSPRDYRTKTRAERMPALPHS